MKSENFLPRPRSLWRVLQEHEFERVGGTGSIRTDVRVIAATNRDLQAAIAGGAFRSDLFYRFNVFPIEVILRERREDIPVLVGVLHRPLREESRKEHPRDQQKESGTASVVSLAKETFENCRTLLSDLSSYVKQRISRKSMRVGFRGSPGQLDRKVSLSSLKSWLLRRKR